MKTEQEIRELIRKTTEDFKHVLDCGPATTQINTPRALMQLSATVRLDALYQVLGERRPQFICDDRTKTNH